jgi:hypothetical protein
VPALPPPMHPEPSKTDESTGSELMHPDAPKNCQQALLQVSFVHIEIHVLTRSLGAVLVKEMKEGCEEAENYLVVRCWLHARPLSRRAPSL